MSVAYILSQFPVLSETFILNEIRELERHCKVHVFAFGRPADCDYSEDLRAVCNSCWYFCDLKHFKFLVGLFFSIYLFQRRWRFVQVFLHALKRKQLRQFLLSLIFLREIRRNGIDHLHTHFVCETSKVVYYISRLSGIPFSFTSHAFDLYRFLDNGEADILIQLNNSSKFHITISRYNRKFIAENFRGLDIHKVKVIHCGVDIKRFSPNGAPKNKTFTILSVGRLVEKKGYEFLIRACRLVKEEGLDFRLWIVGDGELFVPLNDLIQRLGLEEEVVLLGPKSQKDIAEHLKASDVFVLACIEASDGDLDGIPVVLMEAMACGRPVISTSISGIPELVRHSAGVLVEPMNEAALAKAIIEYASMCALDRLRMGRRGRKIIHEHFNLANQVRKLSELVSSA